MKVESLDDQMADLYEQAYIEACELDSPNSPDFDALLESIFERLCSPLPD